MGFLSARKIGKSEETWKFACENKSQQFVPILLSDLSGQRFHGFPEIHGNLIIFSRDFGKLNDGNKKFKTNLHISHSQGVDQIVENDGDQQEKKE